MAKFRTYYDDLAVSRNAPLSVIKAAYRALCQNYHPDKYGGEHEEALRVVKIINEAYSVLSDTNKRAKHDEWIERREKEQVTYEAQRMLGIFAKTYVTPSVTAPAYRPISPFAIVNECWAKLCFRAKNTWRIRTTLVKKISLVAALVGAIGIVSAFVIVYRPDLKTTSPVNENTAEMLTKARRLVKNGQTVKAVPLYLQLAGQGNAEAQFYAGLMYTNGQGLAKDDEQAVSWFGKAAKQGYKEAQSKLGFMYATGKGVAQNYNLAVYWCYQAALQGDTFAQYNLGLMYEKGQGVAKDNNLAASWYSKAAAQGDAHAQFNLAGMYANGQGVAKDNREAAFWYAKAAQQGLLEAEEPLKRLSQ